MKVWEKGSTERRAPGFIRRQHTGQHSLDLGLERGERDMDGQRLIHRKESGGRFVFGVSIHILERSSCQ